MFRFVFALSLAASALAQPATSYQEWITRGVNAYKSARFDEATAAFERATQLQPASVNAHLYLATTYMAQWIPGTVSPENDRLADGARRGFETVLTLEADNKVAIASLASMAYNEGAAKTDPSEKLRKLDEASRYHQRMIELDPRDKDAHYSLGVIAWSKFYPAFQQARAKLGMRPEDPGPLIDADARQQLRTGYEHIVEEGIRHLEVAIEIDPLYDNAMAYLNLLIRERADWRESAEEYKQDVATADAWVHKALEVKRSKAQGGVGGSAPSPPAPPTAGRIRVGTNVQSAQLITKVDPVYPPLARQARMEGVVRYMATIDKQGRVTHLQLLSGHPLLVPAATEAVRQWVYRPTVLNGEPVEVHTTIEVPFKLSQ
jgi:TonB family protein